MVKKYIYLWCVAILLGGCAYSVYSNAYPHLKKVRVEAFENQSSEFEIASTVLNQLSLEFRNDGRLKLVTQNPDCALEGNILSYTEDIYSYDAANQVQDYQLRLLVSVTFTDLINNSVLYENRNLQVSEIYKVSDESSARWNTKAEAEEELIKGLFRIIVQNSLEAW